MKIPHFLLFLVMFAFSCENDEPQFSGIRALIDGESWTADEVVVESAGGAQISRLIAIEDDGLSFVFSFTKLGLTATNHTSDFRKRTGTISSFNYSMISENQVRLNWETSSEENLFYFEVEWSYFEGHSYSYYTTVYANGSSSGTVSYETEFGINLNSEQPIYVRLRMVDFDGQIVYSDPITINAGFPVAVRIRSGSRLECYDGNLTLTKYDPKEKILSGKFNFSYRTNAQHVAVVTNGEISNVRY